VLKHVPRENRPYVPRRPSRDARSPRGLLRCARTLLLALLSACSGHANTPAPQTSPEELVARLQKKEGEITSFTTNSTMDYWLGNQRMKGDVLVMGKPGAMVRFAALSPAGGSTLVEMACNGSDFVMVDYQNNCTLSGPCDATSIAQFFHIKLAPDDFFHLAVGTPPVLRDAKATASWDSEHGYEKLTLTSPAGTQKVTLDLKDGHTDVIDSELAGSDGKVVWSVANADFQDVGGHRVPGKTRFKSPEGKEDLLVVWGDERQLGVALDASKFALAAPSGLPRCGQTVQLQPAGQARPSPAGQAQPSPAPHTP
jgi:outer membrane lipoprotein-sorting protein